MTGSESPAPAATGGAQPGASRVRRVGREILGLAAIGGPLILNNLFNIGVNVADTVMAGRLGATQLAALALGTSVWVTTFLFGFGTLMALAPTVAHHYGSGSWRDIGRDTRQGMWLALVVAVVVILGMRSAAPVLRWMAIEAAVVGLAQGYLDALSWGVVGAFLYHGVRQMSEGTGRTVPIMTVMAVSLPINVALNYVLMFGKWGAPALGVIGAGWGSAMTFWLMFGLLAGYTYRAGFYRRFAIWDAFEGPDRHALARLAAIGLPIGVSLMLQGGLFSAATLLMGALGTEIVAAHQIVLSVSGLVYMIPLGIGMAATVRVGQALGRREPQAARRSGFVAIAVCLALGCVAASCSLRFAPAIVGWYTTSAGVARTAVPLLAIAAVLQIADAAQTAAAGALRGLRDTRVPLLINASIYWCIGFPAAYALGIRLELGAPGIWYGLILALWSAALALALRFRRVVGRSCRRVPI